MIVVSTNSGLEDFLIREIESIGYSSSYLKEGKVFVKGRLDDIVNLNLKLRQAHKVYWLLYRGKIESLMQAETIASSISYKDFYSSSFGVRAKRIGEHNFTSMDLAKYVGNGVWRSLEREGYKPRVNLDNPQMEIVVELSNNDMLLMVNTSGKSLHKRYKRPFQHFAPLKPSIAASMVYALSNIDEIADPMVGGGTTLVEGWMIYREIFPGVYRKEFSFLEFPYFKGLDFYELADNLQSEVREDEPFLFGNDLLVKNILGCKANMEEVNVKALLSVGDVRKLKFDFESVLVNPPYGLRIASKKYIKSLYKAFSSNVSSSEVVVVTAEGRLMKEELERYYDIVLFKPFYYGSLKTYFIKAVWHG